MIPRKRHRLTSAQREQLWDDECAKALAAHRGQFPICNICSMPVTPGRRWHASHDPLMPHALGGTEFGIAHERCNLDHNHKVDTPFVAKNKRRRQKHIGAWQPRGRTIPGRRFNGEPIPSRWR